MIKQNTSWWFPPIWKLVKWKSCPSRGEHFFFELPPLRTAFRRKNTSPSSLLSNCRHWTNKKWVRPHSHVALTKKHLPWRKWQQKLRKFHPEFLNIMQIWLYLNMEVPQKSSNITILHPPQKKVTCFIINFIIIHHHQRHHNILSTSSTSSSTIINVITIRHCHLQTRWILVKCETMMVRWLGLFSLLQFLLEKTK